jgi:hypothetical protein
VNTVDLITDAKTSAEADNKLYARAIGLLQDVHAQLDGDGEVSPNTSHRIIKLLDDSYRQALKETR